MHLVTPPPLRPPAVSLQSRHRRAAQQILVRAALLCLLGACTTPTQAGRLLFQRGATQLPDGALVWLPFTGQIAIEDLDESELAPVVHRELASLLRPQNERAALSLRLQGVILGCRGGARAACACRVVVELVGGDQDTVLRGMEGRAELAMARQADGAALQRALPALLRSAIGSALSAPDRRPPGGSEMARLIRAGDSSRLDQWINQLKHDQLNQERRIVLWIALGHVAKGHALKRLMTIKADTPPEAEARTRALRWIRAATTQAGKRGKPHVESRPGATGELP